MTGFCDAGVVLWLCDIFNCEGTEQLRYFVITHIPVRQTIMFLITQDTLFNRGYIDENIGEQQIIIECPNTIFHLYIDSEDELLKVKVFMNNMKHVDSISLHDIYNWCNRQHVQYTTTFNYDSKMTWTEMIKSYIFYFRQKLRYVNNSDRMIET